MHGWLEVHESTEQTIRRVLESLLSGGIVDGLLVPLRTLDGRNVVPVLIRDPALLVRAAPLAPVMPVNAGTVLGHITATGAPGRVGAVLRNCELRTAIELSKVQQVPLDQVLFIGIDCLGTYRVQDYARTVEEGLEATDPALAVARQGRVEPLDGYAFRPACSMCERPIPGVEDSYAPHIALGSLGVPNDRRLWAAVRDEQLAEVIGLVPAKEPAARVKAVADLIATRAAERDRRFAAFRGQTGHARDPLSLLSEFATCIGCKNCMVTCPICYC